MSVEVPMLRISEEAFDVLETRVDEQKVDTHEGLVAFIRNVRELMSQEEGRGPLVSYVKETAGSRTDFLAYLTGVSVVYTVIATQLEIDERQVEITTDDIAVHRENWRDFLEDPRWHDQKWAEAHLLLNDRPQSDLSWVVDDLKTASADFKAFIGAISADLEGHKKGDFVRGALDVFMLFWSKLDAERSGEFWFPEDY